MLVQKVRRSGNSYIVTIPREEIERLGLRENDLVGLEIRRLETWPELAPEVQAAAQGSLARLGEAYRILKER